MCNAWNHPINCRCGWGGEGHLGKAFRSSLHADKQLASYADWTQEKYRNESLAFFTPNANCPVCGIEVYYYQSPEGGRVFFDELGPPWPKHPCTDALRKHESLHESHRLNKSNQASKKIGASVRRYAWQDHEWAPFVCDRVSTIPHDPHLTAISGIYRGAEIILFVTEKNLQPRAPYQMRRRDESSYFLSTAQFQGAALKVLHVVAYKKWAEARVEGQKIFNQLKLVAKKKAKEKIALRRDKLVTRLISKLIESKNKLR